MRFSLICVLAAVLVGGPACFGYGGGTTAQKRSDFEKLLTAYLQKGLERARLGLKQLKQMQEMGTASVSDVLAAEDEVDKWQLHLRIATEGKLIANHPVLTELRREFGVPERRELPEGARREAISKAIQDYLQKKLLRAEQAADRALALYKFRRGTELEVLAAKTSVESLQLLVAAQRLPLRKGGE